MHSPNRIYSLLDIDELCDSPEFHRSRNHIPFAYTIIATRPGAFSTSSAPVGVPAQLGLTRIIGRMLCGIGANDSVTIVSVDTLLGAMSLAACYLPAHRVMRRNPVTAIREL